MSMLGKVTRGIIAEPHLICLYGPEGVGKSTFASAAPKPIFIDVEAGSKNIDVDRITGITSTVQVVDTIKELIRVKHDYKTVVIDSVDWLETILHREICTTQKVKTIEHASGGYGKGYIEAAMWWQRLKTILARLREERQMNIVLVGHTDVAPFNDPKNQATYDRYQLRMHKRSSTIIKDWVDQLFFMNFETFTKKEDSKTRAFSTGVRKIYTERQIGFDAKNRKGLPTEMIASWAEYEDLILTSKPTIDSQLRQIDQLLTEVIDQEKVDEIRANAEKNKGDITALFGIVDNLRLVVEQQNEQ